VLLLLERFFKLPPLPVGVGIPDGQAFFILPPAAVTAGFP
jgi:hypothetical protein